MRSSNLLKHQETAPREYKEGVMLSLDRGRDDHLYRESLLALRARFDQRAESRGIKVVAVTSAIAGEGKTAVSSSLALLLAKAGGRRVLFVDGDLRKCDASPEFGLPPSPGLSDFLEMRAKEADVVRNTAITNLDVVPGGTRVETGADLFTGERFRGFLSRCRAKYDSIIVDTPPVLPVADTLALKGLVDTFVFVFRAGSTPYPLFQAALEDVGESSVLGVVLNGVEPKSERYYSKYYGKYYSPPPSSSGKKAETAGARG